jgi:hypothetical protein
LGFALRFAEKLRFSERVPFYFRWLCHHAAGAANLFFSRRKGKAFPHIERQSRKLNSDEKIKI